MFLALDRSLLFIFSDGFGFLPQLLNELFEEDEPEHEPAIEVIKVVQDASDKREKQASAPFAAGSVFNKDPIPDDHALELVEVSGDVSSSDHENKKQESSKKA